ncbi:putative mitochondrial monothiol glutaredoxin [Leptomonas pyrrhocoris]|uniref:Putative mitochondrial monothiol glutaredoxin n=1 Tax=Leptomonas pyrrhocoris TaxID=157538 RepID=A0A0M9FP17_LEPPY|nr:putative mitochondrial monothiol glutaredoxin [Leptomonas pyrrhocoris]XP_015651592.1 putative mitochondrial monothiol glutaredoxin [Leptomonas pyrrhocoris]XP_015651593.1 putative mitochondrial monothiol glutaredoxin [Leptomonas pyrrhocoris]XP_015651594.1 putative mitochondrial monothiol glutaredoxin [Leptomonas pyrrhocoris]KPA73152.1 putative mitochondrial monothiol glutaredoxin [Leptomonas pyrrhocoris]KPA73153.1 putative mitochondrial monothiol glutaredoxin [Leptomonas pyrrhocoris]KPA7315|eukprot:XP_015651591.1 putative mitochondrial monothiol glutaredoxin [Leptomonas pyrrhocoris]
MQRTGTRLTLRCLRRGAARLTATTTTVAAVHVGLLSSSGAATNTATTSSFCLPALHAAAAARAFSTTSPRRSPAGNANGPAVGMGGDVDDVEETHPDFQPRIVSTDLADDEVAAIKKDIADTIREEDIVVFIKGVPEAPMCAFSKKMVDVMEALGVEYTSFDVLAHPVVRSYVKEVSEWPTIPQVFIKGEFAGGVDIILKMAESGDLQLLLDAKGIKHRETKL